jgi:3-phosphoshikimate 1-carboxyvinyltransferase
MRAHVTPGGRVEGDARVPGDKSIAHRWLLLAATADGPSRLVGVPRGLDTLATARCLSALAPPVRPALEAWGSSPGVAAERNGSTWNAERATLDLDTFDLRGEGRGSLQPVGEEPLDCGNSGTTMRLLAGLVAACPFESILAGDASLSTRPMERVAEPLRAMGADVRTSDGHPPISIRGGRLVGARIESVVPSAQVKGAVLLAGLAAEGTTAVVEFARTRDHTERALRALGAPVGSDPAEVTLRGPFQHGGLEGTVPGDPSAAAFLLAAAALTGGAVTIVDVGVNPTRLGYLEVLSRMGLEVEVRVETEEIGEPRGRLTSRAVEVLAPVVVSAEEMPSVIDEVPVLAALAAHAGGESRFEGGRELRVKESDRLAALDRGLRSLGGRIRVDGDDLVVEGGGLAGGTVVPADDHRIVMSLAVAALAARGPSAIEGIEAAAVSFPGFVPALGALGARIEEAG